MAASEVIGGRPDANESTSTLIHLLSPRCGLPPMSRWPMSPRNSVSKPEARSRSYAPERRFDHGSLHATGTAALVSSALPACSENPRPASKRRGREFVGAQNRGIVGSVAATRFHVHAPPSPPTRVATSRREWERPAQPHLPLGWSSRLPSRRGLSSSKAHHSSGPRLQRFFPSHRRSCDRPTEHAPAIYPGARPFSVPLQHPLRTPGPHLNTSPAG